MGCTQSDQNILDSVDPNKLRLLREEFQNADEDGRLVFPSSSSLPDHCELLRAPEERFLDLSDKNLCALRSCMAAFTFFSFLERQSGLLKFDLLLCGHGRRKSHHHTLPMYQQSSAVRSERHLEADITSPQSLQLRLLWQFR